MKRVLIIDDAATVRLYHRLILEGAGYQTDEAINGIEALEKVLQSSFDLLLVDVNMAKLDGHGFLRQLRRLDVPQMPAIMISTEASEDDRRLALESGANLYLVKPLKPDQLLASAAILLGEAE
ncbi:response regulator [Paucibacter sp. Y2R2-4]|uniref:response regulator n=1 Tax=Paucibacter sp. Y2R2-4 TaxID=2893553 RepID=UPI0021E44490|nr:response regulator [Paucibacter sp. Y2R2-4]MCV2348325.1 response regulator [Paucibacter sp. Y2R2-4]